MVLYDAVNLPSIGGSGSSVSRKLSLVRYLRRSIALSSLAFGLATCLPTVAEGDETTKSPTAETEARLGSDLQFLSSDALEGRGVETNGIKEAGEFIAKRYAELGFKTDLFDGSPFQQFGIEGSPAIGSAEHNRLVFHSTESGKTIALELGKQFNSLAVGVNGSFKGGIVFLGYGISAPDLSYDDYAGLDVAGKIVIAIRKEPRQNDPQSPFEGTQPSQYSFFTAKEANAALHKAAALILVNDSVSLQGLRAGQSNAVLESIDRIAKLKEAWIAADASKESNLDKLREQLRGELAQLQAAELKLSEVPDPLLDVNGAGRAMSKDQVPTLFLTRAAIDELLVAATGQKLADFEADIEADLKPASVELKGWTAEGETLIEDQEIKARNVVGVLPGKGDLAKEYVVVGAHYDHVGLGGPGSLAPGTIAVHNGADDNGSGTVTLLEIARRLASNTSDNRRTIVFIAFSGEERGLLGSAHYVRNPRFPLEDTVAMVNLDMVGRLSNDMLTVYGTGSAKEFDGLIEELNAKYHFDLTRDPAGRGPSDHMSFFDKKIPVFHFFTGLHNDYHRPSDDFDKINLTGMARISDMVSELVETLSIRSARPTFVDVQGFADVGARRPRVALGVILNTESTNGAQIERVADGSPAADAGIKPGDVLVSIGEKAIGSPADVAPSLTGKRPGDKVTVKLTRDGKEISIEVELRRP